MSEIINQDVAINGEGNIVVGQGDVIINPLPAAETQNRAHLGILVKNVETTWIKGVLERSVHEAALLDLGIEIQTDAVDHPWQMILEAPDQENQIVPKGTKIKSIFNEANNLLLILGDPGSGKTTTLLQLTRELINEIDPAFTQPVPVIFNLSTWIDKKQLLADWLIAELSSKYRTPKKQGKRWLEERRILPLLDGLDEVRSENREACVESINKLVVEYGLQGAVVCSRIKDYTALETRLQFNRAIYLEPLSNEQITEYFQRAGDKLKSVREVLEKDEHLQQMAQSPLMLNIMSLAYQDNSAEALGNNKLSTDEARRQHLFDTYIARMFNRKGDKKTYDTEQTKGRLSWLARNMQVHNQDLFLMEGLQPSWLPVRRWRIAYILVSRLLIGVLIGVLIVGGINGLITGLILGLSISFIDILRLEWSDKWRGRAVIPSFWWSVKNIAIYGLIYALIDGLIYGLIVGTINGLIIGLINGLIVGLMAGLFFGLRGSQRSLQNDIQTVETLRWSWNKALKGGLFVGLIVGLIVWLIVGLIVGLIDGLFVGLIGGLIVGLLLGPLGAVFLGLNREILETKTVPNQGIRLSARSSFLGGLIVGLIVGLINVLINLLVDGMNTGLIDEMMSGLYFGLIGALWYGGLDIIQHYTLRLILIIKGHTPRKYAHFLDHATDLIFLQKVGGGYRFIHRMLLEYFADMRETKEKN